MIVVRDLNVSAAAPDVKRVCSVAGCERDSLLNRVAQAARAPWASWLATPAASWLDDFISWSSPEVPQVCGGEGRGRAGIKCVAIYWNLILLLSVPPPPLTDLPL